MNTSNKVVSPLIRGEAFTLSALTDSFMACYQGRDPSFEKAAGGGAESRQFAQTNEEQTIRKIPRFSFFIFRNRVFIEIFEGYLFPTICAFRIASISSCESFLIDESVDMAANSAQIFASSRVGIMLKQGDLAYALCAIK